MYVYFFKIKDQPMFKIGITSIHPEARLKDVQTGNPYVVYVHKYVFCGRMAASVESRLHERFKEYRQMGEWFHIEESVIDKIIANIELVFKRDNNDEDSSLLDEMEYLSDQIEKLSLQLNKLELAALDSIIK